MRVAQVRQEFAGERGKSRFARHLGVPPSTYDYYEGDRTPPAELLVDIALIAGVDLRWLLTGEAGGGVSADHPVIQRAARLIGKNADAAGPLAAFLEILEGTLAFPDGGSVDGGASAAQGSADAAQALARVPGGTHRDSSSAAGVGEPSPATPAAATPEGETRRRWIPVLGRSAAGVPAFWDTPDDADGLTTLADLIDRHAASERADTQPALVQGEAAQAATDAVQIIAVRDPAGQADAPVEFIDAPAIKARHGDAFAVRIDGESMQPEVRHGDYVVLSPSAPARAGSMAVVQLRGAIGVTCKLYHPEGGRVHLVPINEAVAPATVDADQIDWALRVLARVRP